MLHGLRKKWKQPVAFYLIRGSTNCETLVIFLMEVLDASQNAGLVVVATMFDMGANSFKAFNSWVFLKRHLFSGFMIMILQQGLILLIPLNAHLTISLNMM
jgi:hypothetical protein